MEWIIYTILAVVILAAAIVCVCVFAKTRRDFSRNDVQRSAELLLWKAVVPKAEDSLLKL